MRKFTGLALGVVMALGATTTLTMAQSMAQTHMGHVSTSWKDTPDNKGFLPTAQAEAEIAQFHAGLALKKPDDLAWMQTHTLHVLNAVDPSVVTKGPGLGYGVRNALEGTIKHIGLAAKDADASKNVKIHAEHIATSANNALVRARKIVRLGKTVASAKTAAAAASTVAEIAMLTEQLTVGVDANGDGKITWIKNEGGLDAARKHMGILNKLEGVKMK